jgi:hypothetical protein
MNILGKTLFLLILLLIFESIPFMYKEDYSISDINWILIICITIAFVLKEQFDARQAKSSL